MNRLQVLYKAVSEPPLVEDATSGAADAIDHIDGCAGEPLSDVKGLFGVLDGGEGRFTCTSVNVAYCIRCSRSGLLYIGETKRRLGDDFVEHLHSVHDKRQHHRVTNYFNSPSHSLDDMSILGLLQGHNDTTRNLEEQHLIFCLESLQPNGLNVDFT
eukprot:g24110.t1